VISWPASSWLTKVDRKYWPIRPRTIPTMRTWTQCQSICVRYSCCQLRWWITGNSGAALRLTPNSLSTPRS
jgi:hypothetical protein